MVRFEKEDWPCGLESSVREAYRGQKPSRRGVLEGNEGRIALPVAGDSAEAKAAVLRLVDDHGFDPADPERQLTAGTLKPPLSGA